MPISPRPPRSPRDGTRLLELDDVHYGRRTFLSIREMARWLPLATLAVEDRRFYEHPGVDAVGLIRALGTNAESGDASQGASTIEMQLVRNLYLSDERTERTLARKVKEALAAVELDKRFSKEELLEAYLNVVFYGNRAYGAEAAAQTYFGKSARDLNLAEASLLAGLPQNPSSYDPLLHLDAARARQHEVLDRMLGADMITPDEAIQTYATPLVFKKPPPMPERAQHWVNYILDLTRARFGPEELYTGGLRIRTTIDLDMQQLAEQIVAQNQAVRQTAGADNTAMVVIEPTTGQILAMVGSKDFDDASIAGQVNVSTAVRQPGSSIKPLVYLAGFEAGLNPAVEVLDQPTTFGANAPLNIGRPHMMKTGTTDDYRDTWTIGCIPQICVGVWMGNTNNDPMQKVSSSLTAGKIWVDMMHALFDRNHWAPDVFPRPEGVIVKRIPSVGGVRGDGSHEEVFLEGHEEHPLLDMDWMRPD